MIVSSNNPAVATPGSLSPRGAEENDASAGDFSTTLSTLIAPASKMTGSASSDAVAGSAPKRTKQSSDDVTAKATSQDQAAQAPGTVIPVPQPVVEPLPTVSLPAGTAVNATSTSESSSFQIDAATDTAAPTTAPVELAQTGSATSGAILWGTVQNPGPSGNATPVNSTPDATPAAVTQPEQSQTQLTQSPLSQTQLSQSPLNGTEPTQPVLPTSGAILWGTVQDPGPSGNAAQANSQAPAAIPFAPQTQGQPQEASVPQSATARPMIPAAMQPATPASNAILWGTVQNPGPSSDATQPVTDAPVAPEMAAAVPETQSFAIESSLPASGAISAADLQGSALSSVHVSNTPTEFSAQTLTPEGAPSVPSQQPVSADPVQNTAVSGSDQELPVAIPQSVPVPVQTQAPATGPAAVPANNAAATNAPAGVSNDDDQTAQNQSAATASSTPFAPNTTPVQASVAQVDFSAAVSSLIASGSAVEMMARVPQTDAGASATKVSAAGEFAQKVQGGTVATVSRRVEVGMPTQTAVKPADTITAAAFTLHQNSTAAATTGSKTSEPVTTPASTQDSKTAMSNAPASSASQVPTHTSGMSSVDSQTTPAAGSFATGTTAKSAQPGTSSTTDSDRKDRTDTTVSAVAPTVQVSPVTIAASPTQTQVVPVAEPAPVHLSDTAAPRTPNTQDPPAPATSSASTDLTHGTVNTSKLIQAVGQSDLRVGMRSTEFGDISIHTSATKDSISTQISLDHAELATSLAAHIPEMQARLGSHGNLEVRISAGNQNTGTPSSMSDTGTGSQQGNRQQQDNGSRSYYSQANNTSTLLNTTLPAGMLAMTSQEGVIDGRLDLQA